MAITESPVRPRAGDPWTIADLHWLPDDGNRYEIVDGSLLVSRTPAMPHYRATSLLQRLLIAQAPNDFIVGQNMGTAIDRSPTRTTYLVPDLTIHHENVMDRRKLAFDPAEVLAVVEVLSPSSVGHDQITKRRFYGHVGIRHYWVVDPPNRTLTVLRHNGAGYDEVAVVKPGTTWRTDDPFPLALDPADFT